MENFNDKSYNLIIEDQFNYIASSFTRDDSSIWDILPKIKREEINYSDFFGYFLNPKSNHGLNDDFLKDFLLEVIRIYNENFNTSFSLHPIKIKMHNFNGSNVFREFDLKDYGRPDILIFDKELGISVVIENKLFSKEGTNQTNRYYDGSNTVFDKTEFPASKRLYIFITPDGLDAENEHFISISYQVMIELMSRFTGKGILKPKIENVLLDFIQNVEGIIMSEEQIRIANDIYSKYGEVIDFIYKVGNNILDSADDTWNGEDMYYNIGECEYRDWDDYVAFNFISAGGDRKYSEPLKRLQVGQRIFAYFKGKGYLGVGLVKETAIPMKKYLENNPTFDRSKLKAEDMLHHLDNEDLSEWVVTVQWERTREKSDPVFFKGIFANQNIVCKYSNKQKYSLDKLKTEFNLNGAQQ